MKYISNSKFHLTNYTGSSCLYQGKHMFLNVIFTSEHEIKVKIGGQMKFFF